MTKRLVAMRAQRAALAVVASIVMVLGGLGLSAASMMVVRASAASTYDGALNSAQTHRVGEATTIADARALFPRALEQPCVVPLPTASVVAPEGANNDTPHTVSGSRPPPGAGQPNSIYEQIRADGTRSVTKDTRSNANPNPDNNGGSSDNNGGSSNNNGWSSNSTGNSPTFSGSGPSAPSISLDFTPPAPPPDPSPPPQQSKPPPSPPYKSPPRS
jgi:hypothetical protein